MTPRVRPRRGRSASAAQGGFTMVELMVALLISTVLVAMILSVYMRMSAAYRSQQQISELQQVLQAAQSTVQQDLRLAGYQMSQGFAYASDAVNVVRPAIRIVNSATAPDELYVYYADATAQATVTMSGAATPGTPTMPLTVQVDSTTGFTSGDLVAWVNVDTSIANPSAVSGKDVDGATLATIAKYTTCVLQISSISGVSVSFSTAAPWGKAGNTHCSISKSYPPPTATEPIPVPTMIYKFAARGYRIDPTRKALSVFQRSPSGGLVAGDWQDLGIGFTDFQIASRWYDGDLVDTADADTDTKREWYSGAMQQTLTNSYTGPATPTTIPIVATLSFAVRTARPVEGITTPATPVFVDSARVDNGMIGDRPSAMLSGVPDASRAVENQGNNVYRYSSVRVDLRNMGVGL